MKSLNVALLLNQKSPWICRACTRPTTRAAKRPCQSLQYSTNAPKLSRSRRWRNVILAAAGGTVGVGALALSDDVKHGYNAVCRSGRVVGTLAVCINEYVSTLSL